MLTDFIFQDILCRWGAIQAIVTNNSKPFLAALDMLAKQYSINHMHILGYNAQANSLVKCKHWDLQQALYKIANELTIRAFGTALAIARPALTLDLQLVGGSAP
jgi:hypothetical protein